MKEEAQMNNQYKSLRHILLWIGTFLSSMVVMYLTYIGGAQLLRSSDPNTKENIISAIFLMAILAITLHLIKPYLAAFKEPSRKNILKLIIMGVAVGLSLGSIIIVYMIVYVFYLLG
jgi:ABC-type Fe3+-siderophore transport system permease subunit